MPSLEDVALRLVSALPRKLVPDTELGQNRVDGANLGAAAAHAVAKLCRLEVVVAIECQEGKGREAFDDRLRMRGPWRPWRISW